MKKLLNFFKDEEGISSVEYAMLLAFIAVALITAVVLLRDQIVAAFSRATSALTST
jgi:pilus assembly protein Flp/PilA